MKTKNGVWIYTMSIILLLTLSFIHSCKKEDEVKINNEPELTANQTTLSPYMISQIKGALIQFDQNEYGASFGDSSIILYRVDATTLTFVTPSVPQGSYSLKVSIQSKEFVILYNVTAPTLVSDPANYLQQIKNQFNARIDSTFRMIDSATARGIVFSSEDRKELSTLKTDFNKTMASAASLSQEELKMLSEFLTVNMPAFNETFSYLDQLQKGIISTKLNKKGQTCKDVSSRSEEVKCWMNTYHEAYKEGYVYNRVGSALIFLSNAVDLLPDGIVSDVVGKILEQQVESFDRIMYNQGVMIASQPYRALRLNTFNPPLEFQNGNYEYISVKVLMTNVKEKPLATDLDWEKQFSREFGNIVIFNPLKDLGWGEVWKFMQAKFEYPRSFPQETEQWLVPELKSQLTAKSKVPNVYEKDVKRDPQTSTIKIAFTTDITGKKTPFDYELAYSDDILGIEVESEIVKSANINGVEPFELIYISGNNQQGNYNEWLAEPIKVKVLDANGNGMDNVSVFFKIKDDASWGGWVQSAEVKTVNGFAQTQWKLGLKDDQQLEATVLDVLGRQIKGSPLILTATKASKTIYRLFNKTLTSTYHEGDYTKDIRNKDSFLFNFVPLSGEPSLNFNLEFSTYADFNNMVKYKPYGAGAIGSSIKSVDMENMFPCRWVSSSHYSNCVAIHFGYKPPLFHYNEGAMIEKNQFVLTDSTLSYLTTIHVKYIKYVQNNVDCNSSALPEFGLPLNTSNIYVPFRVKNGSDYYYGWIRISTGNANTLTIHDLAVNGKPNEGIKTGEK